MADRTKSRVHKPAGKQLPLAVPVQVQCDGYRCLAYRNKEGHWVNYHNGEPLHGTVKIIQYDFD